MTGRLTLLVFRGYNTRSDLARHADIPEKEDRIDMKELIEAIAKALVDLPDEVKVTEIRGEQSTILELRVDPTDLGKVIGKEGRMARSLRTITEAAGMKLKRRYTFEIIEFRA